MVMFYVVYVYCERWVQSTCVSPESNGVEKRGKKRKTTNKQTNKYINVFISYGIMHFIYAATSFVICTHVASVVWLLHSRCNKLISFKRDFKRLDWSNDSFQATYLKREENRDEKFANDVLEPQSIRQPDPIIKIHLCEIWYFRVGSTHTATIQQTHRER